MNYIPNKEKYDPWYESIKDEVRKKEMLKHKRKKNKNDKSDSDSYSENDKDDDDYSKYGDEDLYYKEEKLTKEGGEQINKDIKINRLKLIPLLNDGKETVKQAIQRLKSKNNKNKEKNKNKKIKKENYNNNNDNNNNDNKNDNKFNKLLGVFSKLTELS